MSPARTPERALRAGPPGGRPFSPESVAALEAEQGEGSAARSWRDFIMGGRDVQGPIPMCPRPGCGGAHVQPCEGGCGWEHPCSCCQALP